jgi:hypothetical protein
MSGVLIQAKTTKTILDVATKTGNIVAEFKVAYRDERSKSDSPFFLHSHPHFFLISIHPWNSSLLRESGPFLLD